MNDWDTQTFQAPLNRSEGLNVSDSNSFVPIGTKGCLEASSPDYQLAIFHVRFTVHQIPQQFGRIRPQKLLVPGLGFQHSPPLMYAVPFFPARIVARAVELHYK